MLNSLRWVFDRVFKKNKRRFDRVIGYEHVDLPERKTKYSAGYDIAAATTVMCQPHEITIIPTGLKAYMNDDEFLAVYVRSSVGIKKGLMMANSVGVIDADYADNIANDGHIHVALYNTFSTPITIPKGECVAQGVFTKFGVTCDDDAYGERVGGFGSTNRGHSG